MKTIGIIGLGVMGGSFASRLKELGYDVIGFDIQKNTLEYALENGMIDRGFTDPQKGLAQCDTLIICLYPSLMADWIEKNQNYFSPNVKILEIAGVKEGITTKIRSVLRPNAELISIHPMCGRESRGPEFSSPEIFKNANFLIVPDESNRPESILEVQDLARSLGCKRVSLIDVAAHDQAIAFLSQLTHIIAVSLMNTHESEHLVEYTGDSFRDLTRIASINEDMWSELFIENKPTLLEELSAFEKTLSAFREALETEDTETMKEMMKISTIRRKSFDKDAGL